MPLAVVSPMSTPIAASTSLVFVPSLTRANVTVIVCALVTPVRFTVTDISNGCEVCHATRACSHDHILHRHGVRKRKHNRIIVIHATGTAFDAGRATRRQIYIERAGHPVDFSRHDTGQLHHNRFDESPMGRDLGGVESARIRRGFPSCGITLNKQTGGVKHGSVERVGSAG